MSGKKRSKTKHTNIYLNNDTNKYDVKINYKVYNSLTQKNEYKSKWIYGIKSISLAKEALAEAHQKLKKGDIIEDRDITLKGIYELWKIEAKAKNFSPKSLENTYNQYAVIKKFMGEDYFLKNVTENDYLLFISKLRETGYSEQTIYSVNAAFRKFINLAFRKELLKVNPLDRFASIPINKKKLARDKHIVTYDEFKILDNHYKNSRFIRLGVDNNPKKRLILNILYFTGVRIGEAIALTYNDFEHISHLKGMEFELSEDDDLEITAEALMLNVDKDYLSNYKLVKDTKTKKSRKVTLDYDASELFFKIRLQHLEQEGDMSERVFPFSAANFSKSLEKACIKNNLPHITCHDFRHTFISNLINENVPLPVIEAVSGDTQQTIVDTYSHMINQDSQVILEAMKRVKTGLSMGRR